MDQDDEKLSKNGSKYVLKKEWGERKKKNIYIYIYIYVCVCVCVCVC